MVFKRQLCRLQRTSEVNQSLVDLVLSLLSSVDILLVFGDGSVGMSVCVCVCACARARACVCAYGWFVCVGYLCMCECVYSGVCIYICVYMHELASICE